MPLCRTKRGKFTRCRKGMKRVRTRRGRRKGTRGYGKMCRSKSTGRLVSCARQRAGRKAARARRR